jgi:hypothetical protein
MGNFKVFAISGILNEIPKEVKDKEEMYPR